MPRIRARRLPTIRQPGVSMLVRLALLVAALALPATLAAQPPVAPAQPRIGTITDSFRQVGGMFGGWLLAALDSIPASRYGYKPTPVQQSVGFIAQHVTDANYVLCERIGGVPRPVDPTDALPDTVRAAWPKDTLVTRLRESLVFCGDAFARTDDAMLDDPVPAGAPGSGETAPRARMVALVITDLAEHYAQIASYMRLMGLVPPSALPRPER